MSRGALIFGLVFSPIFSFAVQAQSAVTEQEAQAIARDAYIYFYPLLTMDVTRKQLTNVEPGKGIGAPMNNLFSVPTFPTADMKQVVRPNFDTLYSFGYLDLTKEPMVVSVPDTGGRYYLLPMLDMWTDVFASPGCRTTGTQAGNFLVTPLGWSGTVPAGFTLIGAPTSYVWIISAAPKLTARRTTKQFTKFRPGTKSHRSRTGANRPNRSRQRSTPRLT